MTGRHYGHESSVYDGKSRRLIMDFFLIVDRPAKGARPGVRVTANEPALKRTERAINLKMELPVALFEAPLIRASIMVDEPDVPVTLDLSALSEAVQTAVGMDVHIEVVDERAGT